MRVVHLIKATRISGAERHLLILLTALRKLDVDAHLLLLVEPNTLMDDLIEEAAEREIPVGRVVIHNDADVRVIGRLRESLRTLKPDILHTHLIHADAYGFVAGKLAGIRRIISSRHNDDPFRKFLPLRLSHRALWRGLSAGIAISDAIRKFIVDVEGAPEKKLHVVRYGLEFERIQPAAINSAREALRTELNLPSDTFLFGMACRLTPQKGISDALKAFASIQHERNDVHFIIAGDGELKKQLVNEAKQLGIASRVYFLGWREDVKEVLAALDVFLMPSLWEGFGLVLIEAMSRRIPVIASNVSAIPEIVVDGESGILIPPEDPQALAGAMQLLLQDRALRAYIGLLGEDRVETHFTAERMAKETLDIYQGILPKGRK